MRRASLPALAAATFFAATFLLANIPGNPVIGPDPLRDGQYGPYYLCSVSSVVHGWPFTFLRHDGYSIPPGFVVSAWKIGGNPRFTPAALIANVALLATGTLLIGGFVRRRIQRHGWRFGVIHGLAAMLSASVIAASMTSRYRIHQAQISRLQRAGYSGGERQPFGPYWLRTITGPQCWEWGDLLVSVDVEHSDEIAELQGKSAIKVLRIENIRCDAIPSLDDYDSLVAINMSLANYDDEPAFWRCLRVIAQCDSIQALNLYDSVVTDRGLQELSRMPNLMQLELSRNGEITDAGLAHLASIKSLKKLELWGTVVTKVGVDKLRAALPDCEVDWDAEEEL